VAFVNQNFPPEAVAGLMQQYARRRPGKARAASTPRRLPRSGAKVSRPLAKLRRPRSLSAALWSVAEALRYNFEGYTSEVRWTDRVFAFTSNYLNDYARPPLPRVDPGLLYGSATGDLGRVDYVPLNAVRYFS